MVSQENTPQHGVGVSGLLDLVDPLVERGAVIDAKNNVRIGRWWPRVQNPTMPMLILASFTYPILVTLSSHPSPLDAFVSARDSMRCFP